MSEDYAEWSGDRQEPKLVEEKAFWVGNRTFLSGRGVTFLLCGYSFSLRKKGYQT
jgi:hypothetical protein